MTAIEHNIPGARLGDGKPVPLVIASILRPEGTTGVHTHIRELCAYLGEQQLPYTLITPFSWGQPWSNVIFGIRPALQWIAPPTSVSWYRYWHTAFLAAALRHQLTQLGPALIYAQGPEAAWASIRARQHAEQRVIMAVHFLRSQTGGWISKGHITPHSRTAKAIQASERRLVPKLDRIIYVSRAANQEFVSALPDAASVPSDIVPNFVRPIDTLPVREPLGDLVTIGALEKEKNQDFLLRVLALAKDAGHTYTLDIYGTGSLRRRLERTAKILGLAAQVRLRGYNPAVRTVLPAYRAYVHACAVETGPLALIEALQAGLPILAPDQGGVRELLSNGVEGLYWPLDDPRAASGILNSLMLNEAFRQSASRAAKLRFNTHLDSRLLAPKLTSALYGTPFFPPATRAHEVPTPSADHDTTPPGHISPPRFSSTTLTFSSLRRSIQSNTQHLRALP